MYVVSTQYLRLLDIEVDFALSILDKRTLQDDLRATFKASEANELIAFDTEESAMLILDCLMQSVNKIPDLFGGFGRRLASPVIFVVDVDETKLPRQSPLVVNDLVDYVDRKSTSQFPYAPTSGGIDAASRIEAILVEKTTQPYIYKLSGVTLENVREAIYFKVDADELVRVDLTPRGSWLDFFKSYIPAAFTTPTANEDKSVRPN